MMSAGNIYGPVTDDLDKVEEELGNIPEVDIPLLKELLEYCIKNGGKRIRPAFTLLSGKFNNYNLARLVPMGAGVELLHTATLVHDDVVDNSDLRRGKPTVSKGWGSHAALLLGDYLFAKAAMLVADTGNIRVIKLFAQTLMTISGGELAQIDVLFDRKRAREHYFQWIAAKTACLFSTSTQSGAILSDAPEETITALKNYGYYFGMAFQVIDDVLDFTGKEAELGKPVGSDLREGAVTLPSIIFAESEKGKSLIRDVIENKQIDYVTTAIEMINNSSILDECLNIAEDFSSKACQALSALPDNDAKQTLISIVDYMLKRRK
jgi:geranylgeranyl pyrophosphate synthase